MKASKINKSFLIYAAVLPISVTIVCLIVYFIYTRLREDKEMGVVKDEIKALEKEGITPTLSASQINSYALKLYRAMDGAGTDEEQVFSVFNAMGNDADVLNLIKAFGLKEDENLSQWLADDFSQSDLDKINNILASKNIEYRF